MDRKKLVLLLGALIIAIGTAIAARSMFTGGAAPNAEAAVPTGPRVLVAKRALTAGTIITADALGFQPWPKELVQDAYFIDGEADMNKLLGTVVRYPITAGEPVTQGSLVAPGDRGFLAAALGPGMRAVTVKVSQEQGVAGFVFPGDRVDVLLAQTIEVKVRNRKKEPAEIRVVEHANRGGNWTLTAQSQPHEKKDATTFEFRAPLQPDEEKTVTYTIRYTW